MFVGVPFGLYFFSCCIDISLFIAYHKIMKLIRAKVKREGGFLKTIKAGVEGYLQKSAKNVYRLMEIFGEQKTLGYVLFLLQPVVAIGQVVLGYHFLFTLGYVFVFNLWLLKKAKKKSEDKE